MRAAPCLPQLIQGKLADMYTRLQSSRAYVYTAARDADAGRASRKDCASVILLAAEVRGGVRACVHLPFMQVTCMHMHPEIITVAVQVRAHANLHVESISTEMYTPTSLFPR